MGLRRSPVGKHAAGGACSGGGAGEARGTGSSPGRSAGGGAGRLRMLCGAGGGRRGGARRHRGAARRSRYGQGAAGTGSAGPAARGVSSRPLLSHAPSSVPRLLAASGGRGARGREARRSPGGNRGDCSCVAAPQCAESGRAVRSRARSAMRGRPSPTSAAKAFVRNYLGVTAGGRKGRERSAGVQSRAVRSSGRLCARAVTFIQCCSASHS